MVARIVEHLRGQLRVDPHIGDDRFAAYYCFPNEFHSRGVSTLSRDDGGVGGGNSEIDSLSSAISTIHIVPHAPSTGSRPVACRPRPQKEPLLENRHGHEAPSFHTTHHSLISCKHTQNICTAASCFIVLVLSPDFPQYWARAAHLYIPYAASTSHPRLYTVPFT